MDLYTDKVISAFEAHSEVVGTVSFNLWDNSIICSGSGERHFSMGSLDDFSDEEGREIDECDIKIWQVKL
jgi:hypothetical protein